MLSKVTIAATLPALFSLVFAQNSTSSNVTSYAPSIVNCPSGNLVRFTGTPQGGNQTLNPDETAYITSRKQLVQSNLRSWLGNNLSTVYGGDFNALSTNDLPTLALALSGGNFRAALFNAGALEAFDARNDTSVSKGLGGLLQSSTYMSALSGGAYVLTSLMFNEFPTIPDLVFGSNVTGSSGWQLSESIFAPGPSGSFTQVFVGQLLEDLAAKRQAGNFPVTFCDMWGRALAYHLLPGTPPGAFNVNTTAGNHAAALTYSSATSLKTWQDHTMPFPIILANVNSPNARGQPFGNTGTVPLTTVVYEITPLEFGSYEPQLGAFIPLKYLGSTFANGSPTTCVNNFDNAGLMMGTSACDFNFFNVTNNPAWTSPQGFRPLISAINSTFAAYQPNQELDVTSVANPFLNVNVATYQDTNETALSLFDGSLDVENDPILPLLVKKRNVDVIVLLDSSGETNESKPDGLSLLATKQKAAILPAGTINFPTPFPNSTDEFISLGLNARPVFFGCDGANSSDAAFPLLVYIPNNDPTGVTNITTSTLQVSNLNQSLILENSNILASRGYVGINNTDMNAVDNGWSTCVACAVMERARARNGLPRTATCQSCFSRYCFTAVNATSFLSPATGAAAAGTKSVGATVLAAIVALLAAILI